MSVDSRAAAAVQCRGIAVSWGGRGVIWQEGGTGHSLNCFKPSGGGNGVGGYGVSLNCFGGREVGKGCEDRIVLLRCSDSCGRCRLDSDSRQNNLSMGCILGGSRRVFHHPLKRPTWYPCPTQGEPKESVSP